VFQSNGKKAQVIILLKPGKTPERATSYRSILLLPSMSKLFEKLLLSHLKQIIEERNLIPDYQFGFRNKHLTINQVHHVTNIISRVLEEKNIAAEYF